LLIAAAYFAATLAALRRRPAHVLLWVTRSTPRTIITVGTIIILTTPRAKLPVSA